MTTRGREDTKKQLTNPHYDTRSVQNKTVSVLIVSVVVPSLIILFSPNESKIFVCDIIEPLSAAVAVGLSIVVIYRQKIDGLIGKAYASLAIGLALFLAAELIWSYYEIGLGVQSPFPSVADGLWLIGYGPLFYYVFKMYGFFGGSHSKYQQILILAGAVAFLSFPIGGISESANFKTPSGITSFLISVAYPIFDVVLIVPSALIMLNSPKGELTSVPWIFLAFLIMSLGDSIFAYASNIPILQEFNWIWNLFFISSYLVMAAGLFWHGKFFIFNQKKE